VIRNGKNVSMVGQIAAIAALSDQDYLKAMLTRLKRGQEVLAAGLDKLGLFYRATPANFVLIKFDDPAKVQTALAAKHIYVRPMSHLPKMTGFLRITLGSAEQMEEFLAALRQLI
jgi:histidinol-phosphate aminotransferase